MRAPRASARTGRPSPRPSATAVTAASRRVSGRALLEVGVDRLLRRRRRRPRRSAPRASSASASRQSSRTAWTAQRCVRVGCGSSSSALSSQTMSSRAASPWNARVTSSTRRPVSLGDGEDVGRLHQLGRERVRPGDLLRHAGLDELRRGLLRCSRHSSCPISGSTATSRANGASAAAIRASIRAPVSSRYQRAPPPPAGRRPSSAPSTRVARRSRRAPRRVPAGVRARDLARDPVRAHDIGGLRPTLGGELGDEVGPERVRPRGSR